MPQRGTLLDQTGGPFDIGQEAVQGHYDQPAGEVQEGHLHHADQA